MGDAMKVKPSMELAMAASRQRQTEIKNRNREAVFEAIVAAGKQGITRARLTKLIGIDTVTVGSRLAELMEPSKRIHIVAWQEKNGHLYPVYAAGNEPDAPKETSAIQLVDRYENVEDLAREDARASHRAWEAGWKPHCDPAAAWMKGAV